MRWSSGTEPPKLQAPPNTTDCHFHLYNASFPIAPYATLKPPEASVDDYQALRRRLGVGVLSWRWAFLINVPVAFVILLLTLIVVRNLP